MRPYLRLNPFLARPVLILGALALAGPSSALQDAVPNPEEITRTALEREALLGLERIDLGAGHYELALPEGHETPAMLERGGVIWSYEGQARFTDAPARRGPRMVFMEAEVPVSDVDRLLGSKAVDSSGRQWSLIGVDVAALEGEVRAYDKRVAELFGLEPIGPVLPSEEDDHGEGWVFFDPLTWYGTNCDSDSTLEIRRWNSDGRQVSSDPMTTRQRKVVIISTPGGKGSGVMVDDEWVLTAAHVITTSSGSFYNPSTYDICTFGNYQSNKIKTRIDVATGHSGGPFYYYPSGCCGSHYVTGVVSAFVNPTVGNAYVGGPKGSAIRSWVIANTP